VYTIIICMYCKYNDGIHLTHLLFHPRSGDEMNAGIVAWNQKSKSRASARRRWM